MTGPDEYNTVVNNNTFTNLMARENLRYAAAGRCERLQRERPDAYAALVHRTGLEAERGRRAGSAPPRRCTCPYDEELGIHPQDDGFLEPRARGTSRTRPATTTRCCCTTTRWCIYRHQVIKQADVVLAMFLLGDEFTPEQKRRNFDYYDPLTTGDSSLSVCIQSIVAVEIGLRRTRPASTSGYAALMDLADVGGNVKDGAHIASIGGTWMALVYGFAGLRDTHGVIRFRPWLPERDLRLRFRLTVRESLLELEIDPGGVRYQLLEGDPLEIHHHDEPIRLELGQPVSR